jgi:hypothetical protein
VAAAQFDPPGSTHARVKIHGSEALHRTCLHEGVHAHCSVGSKDANERDRDDSGERGAADLW